jgi:hypothetical protein
VHPQNLLLLVHLQNLLLPANQQNQRGPVDLYFRHQLQIHQDLSAPSVHQECHSGL